MAFKFVTERRQSFIIRRDATVASDQKERAYDSVGHKRACDDHNSVYREHNGVAEPAGDTEITLKQHRRTGIRNAFFFKSTPPTFRATATVVITNMISPGPDSLEARKTQTTGYRRQGGLRDQGQDEHVGELSAVQQSHDRSTPIEAV